jgi:hypothetical protein
MLGLAQLVTDMEGIVIKDSIKCLTQTSVHYESFVIRPLISYIYSLVAYL